MVRLLAQYLCSPLFNFSFECQLMEINPIIKDKDGTEKVEGRQREENVLFTYPNPNSGKAVKQAKELNGKTLF
jgi:hypothetical protein